MLPIFTTEQVKDGIDSGDLLIDLTEYMKKKDGATKTELESLVSVVAGKLDASPQHKHHIDDIKQLETALAGKYDTSEKYSYSVILSDSEKIPFLEAPKVETLEIAKDNDSNGYKLYVDDSNGDLMIVHDDMLIGTYVKSSHNWIFGGVNLAEMSNIGGVQSELDALSTTVTGQDARITENSIDIAANLTKITELVATVTDHDARITENAIDIASNLTKITGLMATMNDYIAKTDAVLKNHYDALLLLCQKHGMVDSDGADGDRVTPE